MAENTYKEPVEEKATSAKGTSKPVAFLQSLLNGSFLTFDRSPGLLPFLLFVTSLAVLLIANTYYAEKKVRQIERLRHEVTELRSVYISNKTEMMHLTNQSEIARRLASHGFAESVVPPRIIVEKNNRRSFLLRVFNPRN